MEGFCGANPSLEEVGSAENMTVIRRVNIQVTYGTVGSHSHFGPIIQKLPSNFFINIVISNYQQSTEYNIKKLQEHNSAETTTTTTTMINTTEITEQQQQQQEQLQQVEDDIVTVSPQKPLVPTTSNIVVSVMPQKRREAMWDRLRLELTKALPDLPQVPTILESIRGIYLHHNFRNLDVLTSLSLLALVQSHDTNSSCGFDKNNNNNNNNNNNIIIMTIFIFFNNNNNK